MLLYYGYIVKIIFRVKLSNIISKFCKTCTPFAKQLFPSLLIHEPFFTDLLCGVMVPVLNSTLHVPGGCQV